MPIHVPSEAQTLAAVPPPQQQQLPAPLAAQAAMSSLLPSPAMLVAVPPAATSQSQSQSVAVVERAAVALPSLSAVLADGGAAAMAAFLAALPVSMIDKGIVENAAGRATIASSVAESAARLVRSPAMFLRRPEFLLVWGVYTATFGAANLSDSVLEANNTQNEAGKLAVTTAANVVSAGWKDRALGVLYSGRPPAPFPLLSWSLFFTRDLCTIAASFTVPKLLAQRAAAAAEANNRDNGRDNGRAPEPSVAARVLPVVGIQALTVPLHLLAYNLYNRPSTAAAPVPVAARATFIRAEYARTLAARGLRVLPAFGLGTLTNSLLRRELRSGMR